MTGEIDQEEKLKEIQRRIRAGGKVLVGIGAEWRQNRNEADETEVVPRPEIEKAYGLLYELIKETDYFLVTTVTDGMVWKGPFDPKRIVAPCGNIGWQQCSQACTKDIWEAGEVESGRCPHCGSPLVSNTIRCGCYIEEGYLPQWQEYTKWLSRTLNQPLTVIELGEGFAAPTVIRWPFEKTVFLNQNAYMYRLHGRFSQIRGELTGKAEGIPVDSVKFMLQNL